MNAGRTEKFLRLFVAIGLESAFERIRFLETDGFLVAVNGDHQGEADRGFGGGDRDGEDHEHHAGGRRGRGTITPEGDEIDVRRVEHQLDTEEDEDGVAPREGADEADAEKRAGEQEAEVEGRSEQVES